MQNLLAMACIGQSSLNPNASSQTIPTAQLNTASPLCMQMNGINFAKNSCMIKRSFVHCFVFCFIVCFFLGSVQDYAASMPQYTSSLYAPSLQNATLNTAVSLIAGKQVEGKYSFHIRISF